jgi:hypothetical protein
VQNNYKYFYLFFTAHEFKIHQVIENNTADIFICFLETLEAASFQRFQMIKK